MFNVAIIGGEDTGNYEFFKDKCIFFLKNKAKSGEGITIYTTGDSYIEKFCARYGIDTRTFYTKWKEYGKMALKTRNDELLKECNALIYFDNGIKDQEVLFNMAKKNSIPVRKIAIT